jgi:hypothetical protein
MHVDNITDTLTCRFIPDIKNIWDVLRNIKLHSWQNMLCSRLCHDVMKKKLHSAVFLMVL